MSLAVRSVVCGAGEAGGYGQHRYTHTVIMPRKKISTTVYVEPDQDAALRALRDQTGIPTAVLIRDAIDIMLKRSADDYRSVIAHAEDVVSDRREAAERDNRYADVIVEELDILTTHARQLEVDLADARGRTQHYRKALAALRDSIDAVLKATPDTRASEGSEPLEGP